MKKILSIQKKIGLVIFISLITFSLSGQQQKTFHRENGYKGIWFELGQKSAYGDKYSGGLGTYTAKHRPLAIYDSTSNKTYFVYGGTTAPDEKHLLCMISYYDHETGKVPKPVVVFDKYGVDDPHDNPSLLIDDDGYLWVFVSGRGRGRMGYKYRSVRPHSIDTFQQVREEEMTYPQPWFVKGKGLFHFFTKYTGMRELYFETSADGFEWSVDQKLAAIKRPEDKQAGHYQVSDVHLNKLGTFFNWHPNGNVDMRTNLYYLETTDLGKTWHSADGNYTSIPVTNTEHSSRVAEFFADGKNVYLKDMDFDESGNPVCLFLVSNGHKPGPENDLRVWKIARWTGNLWEVQDVCSSDHNYDMGSLYIGKNYWQVIAPTEPGPQPWGVGGEMVIWRSRDKGKNWKKVKQVTRNSDLNNSYLRRPENAHPDFYGFWANGNPDKFSKSELFFMNKKGKVFRLPYQMENDFNIPQKK